MDCIAAVLTIPLLSTSTMTGTRFWREARDGDPVGLALYRRHYSRRRYADGRDPALFVGPGEKTVLISHDDDALFVWRKFIDASGQEGINCAVFRNESPYLASDMILDAESWARSRWPGQRFYTYVNQHRIRSTNPGYCFKRAGWRVCGETRGRPPLVILEKANPIEQPVERLPPRPDGPKTGTTTIGSNRDAYSALVEGRPRRFPTAERLPGYLAWCARADEWAVSTGRA